MVVSTVLSIMKSIICILIAVVLIVPDTSSSPPEGEANDVKLTSDDANSFLIHKFVRYIDHECYEEGCSFEEVAETKGETQEAREYFFTYTCKKFGTNCKVPCTYRKDCSVGNWGSWRGNVDARRPGCYEQTRSKPFNNPLQTTYRRTGCDGLRNTCGSPPTEKRKQCVCRKVSCRPEPWEQWTGYIKEGTCDMQTRKRTVSLTLTLVQQTGSCSGIPTTCSLPKSEDRKMCSCKYAKCSISHWSEWEPKELKQDQCVQQQRRRKIYSLTFAYRMFYGECPSLPQVCPNDRVENRTQCGPTSEPVNTTEAPTTRAQSAKYESLGCFKDRGKKSLRPLPLLIANLRKNIDWKNLNDTIQACADEAKARGLEYFALQYYGECWSGPNAGQTYARDGRYEKGCTKGVGKNRANAVYRITNLPPPW